MFNGGKINIGTNSSPLLTDSLLSVYNHFKNKEIDILDSSKTKDMAEFTDEELAMLNDKIRELKSEFSGKMLKQLNYLLYTDIINNYDV